MGDMNPRLPEPPQLAVVPTKRLIEQPQGADATSTWARSTIELGLYMVAVRVRDEMFPVFPVCASTRRSPVDSGRVDRTRHADSRPPMKIRYFQDTDTMLISMSEKQIAETRDLTDNILVELDAEGKLVSMTIEHATQQTDIREFSFEHVAS